MVTKVWPTSTHHTLCTRLERFGLREARPTTAELSGADRRASTYINLCPMVRHGRALEILRRKSLMGCGGGVRTRPAPQCTSRREV